MNATIWPTVAALVAMAVMMIERLQVDFAFSCSVGTAPGACDSDFVFGLMSWMVGAVVFGVGHVLGGAALHGDRSGLWALVKRLARALAFLAVMTQPAFGALLFLVALAAGAVVGITVIGIVIAPVVGAAAAGFVAGAILAVTAGAPRPASRLAWRRRVKVYGIGGTIGGVVILAGQVALDPSFSIFPVTRYPGWTSLGALTTVAVACLVMAMAAVAASGSWRQALGTFLSPGIRPGLVLLAMTIAALTIAAQVMVQNDVTVFPREGGWAGPIARQVRQSNPPLREVPTLANLTYVGPRDVIKARRVVNRRDQVRDVIDQGGGDVVYSSRSIDRPIDYWELRGRFVTGIDKPIYLYADDRPETATGHCLRRPPDREVCDQSRAGPPAAGSRPVERPFAGSGFDAFEIADDTPDASLTYRYAPTTGEAAPDPFGRRFCALDLVNITPAALSATQQVPCDIDWRPAAARLRAGIEALFRPEEGASRAQASGG